MARGPKKWANFFSINLYCQPFLISLDKKVLRATTRFPRTSRNRADSTSFLSEESGPRLSGLEARLCAIPGGCAEDVFAIVTKLIASNNHFCGRDGTTKSRWLCPKVVFGRLPTDFWGHLRLRFRWPAVAGHLSRASKCWLERPLLYHLRADNRST